MITNLKPYPAYKDSGVAWLGQVPEHWEVRRTKTILRERSDKGFPNEPLLAATQTKGVIRKEQYENRTVLALKDLHLLKLVETGDFVISLRSFQGGIEYARERGIISPAYTIVYPRDANNHAYLAFLFKSRPYIENLQLFVTGIRQGQNIDYERLSRSPLPLPPLPEQTAIVRFLDYMDRRIRRFIRAKQKLIKLLEEYRQALIHQAVTGKIDVRTGQPYPTYKDAGVPWLGQVPAHWEVRRLRNIVELRVSNVDKHSKEGEQPVRLCNYVDVYRHERIRANMQFMKATASVEEIERFRLERGDVLITKDSEAWDDIAVPVLVESAAPDLISGYHLALLRPSHVVEGAFLLRALQSPQVAYQFHVEATGVTRYGLSHDAIKSALVPLPPLPEQTAIVEYLDAQTAKLDTAIAAARREIELLREYRERLIADVVTGKVDVRGVAAQLPEEPPEEEAGTEEEEPVAEELATVDSQEEANGEE